MSSTITTARPRWATSPRNLHERRELARAAREDVLAAVAEANAGDPAGATNALLAELTPDIDVTDRVTALVWLQEDGLLIRDRATGRLRLTCRGHAACRTQWSDATATTRTVTEDTMLTATPADVVTAADANVILAQFSDLAARSPELGSEVRQTLSRPWRVLDRAVLRGEVEITERERVQVNCLVAGIRERLADVSAEA